MLSIIISLMIGWGLLLTLKIADKMGKRKITLPEIA